MSDLDKAKDKAQEMAGKAKEAVGKVINDRRLEREGKADEASGNLKQAGEKIKDTFK